MNKSLLFGATCALLLAGCATDQSGGKQGMDAGGGEKVLATPLDQICATKAVRCIEVVIRNNVITQVNDETFMGPNHLILWKMNPLNAAYTFPDDGIDWKKGSAARPPDEFNCRAVAQRHLFICSNRNSVVGTYSYNVTLNPVGGGAAITKDPQIFNR